MIKVSVLDEFLVSIDSNNVYIELKSTDFLKQHDVPPRVFGSVKDFLQKPNANLQKKFFWRLYFSVSEKINY